MKNLKKNAILIIILFTVIFISSFMKNKVSEFEKPTIQTGMVVANLQKSVDFYKNVIGMQQSGSFKVNEEFSKRSGLTGGIPFEVTVLKLEDSEQADEYKLMSFNRPANHPHQKFIQDDTGIQYITIFVKSMKPFLKRIKQHNIKLIAETPTNLDDGRQFVLIQDPDGTFIELIGPE